MLIAVLNLFLAIGVPALCQFLLSLFLYLIALNVSGDILNIWGLSVDFGTDSSLALKMSRPSRSIASSISVDEFKCVVELIISESIKLRYFSQFADPYLNVDVVFVVMCVSSLHRIG